MIIELERLVQAGPVAGRVLLAVECPVREAAWPVSRMMFLLDVSSDDVTPSRSERLMPNVPSQAKT